jgi:superfamily II DNA/RNA helicase
MVLVYYSHLGEDQFKNVEWPENIQFSGKISQLIEIINGKYPGFKNCILNDNGKLLSSVRIYKNVVIDGDNRILDGDKTKEIKKIDDENSTIVDSDNLLFSSYDPKKIGKLLESVLVHSPGMLKTKHQNRDEFIENEYSTFIGDIQGPTEEIIYEFKTGECTLKELEIEKGKSLNIEFNETTDLFNIFNRKKSTLLPSALVDGIIKILELPSKETRLRAHQEDALFYILGKLLLCHKVPFDALLLSIPTGGGKTEAFLIPIVSYIFNDKMKEILDGIRPESRIRTIITYPTKALANDQANRIVEILYSVNKQSTPDQKISLGILTGDTPSSGGWKLKKSNLIQLCPECQSANFDYTSADIGEGRKINLMECKHCGAKLDFLRLTREDILTDCPDILITNLDEINYCLQSKRYRPLFSNKIDLMIFDEIHLCESVFGCHTSHLLRRLEAAGGYKPLYIGVSATIQNAEDLASLIFDVDKNKILFLRHQTSRPYITDQPDHYRYHYIAVPKITHHNRYYQVLTSTIRTTDVLGHSIIDPHFRKTLVFCNYRQDTDKYITYMQNQQERYFDRYNDGIRQKIILGQKITKPELEIARDIGGYYEFLLSQKMLFNASLKIGWHRGGLEQEEQLRAITRFSTSQAITWEDHSQELPVDIMVATKTLELGIDIGDVSNVFNSSAPFTVNEYVQRIGRGGRKKDASAITILDPSNPLDFYFQRHFDEYVIPEKRKFEDAPIIITNESILKNHIYARILDYIVENLQKNFGDVKVDELSKLNIQFNGEVINLIDNPDLFGEAVFERFFTRHIIDINGQEISAIERFQGWIKRESYLLQVKITNISQEDIKKILIEKCREISEKINSTEYTPEAYLSGFSGKDQSLVPKLRGSGASCNIILVQGRTDKVKDNVTRRRAISSMPLGGFSSQGANSFIVYNYDLDSEIQRSVRKLFGEKPDSWNYFHLQFGDNFPKKIDDIELRTPKNLKVKYFPYRFYCPKCGKMYQGPTNDDRCSDGCGELRQITELFICGECGKVYEPPVPMVCIHPNHLAHEPQFIESLNTKGKRPKYDLFRFNALPKLRWQCKNKKCGAIFDFYNRFSKQYEFPKSFMDKRPIDLDYANPEDVAKHYEYWPESSLGKSRYVDEGYNLARYRCDCGAGNKIRPKNIPTVRSIVVEFILWDYELMSKLDLPIGRIEFNKVDVIDLAREYSMRFYKMSSKNSASEINKYEIFKDDPQTYLANTFGTHAASFNIDKSTIEKFIDTQQDCLKGKCNECKKIECVDNSERTRPTTELEKIELEKTPDVRRKWCSLSRRRECAYNDKEDCSDCREFLPRDFLKYILLHTLKHAIILAMPKYTGINKNEVRGIIYPNDELKPELVFLDVHEDGSGSIYLMKRNWSNIWTLTEEIMNNAASGKGTLMLTHFCERYNKDLCPILGSKFFAFLKEERLNLI